MIRFAQPGDYGVNDSSARPHLWDRCVSAFCPSMGPAGNKIYDHGIQRYPLTTTSGDLYSVVDGRWAVTLNGSQYFSMSGFGSTNFNVDNFSICAWAKPAALSGTGLNAIVCRSGTSGTSYWGWLLGFNNGYAYAYGGTSAVNYPVSSSAAASTGSWYHLAFVRSATQGELFVNGVSEGTVAIPAGTALSTSTTGMSLGRRDASSGFSGSIDDVRLYRKALDQQDISELATRRGIAFDATDGDMTTLIVPSAGFAARKTFSRLVH